MRVYKKYFLILSFCVCLALNNLSFAQDNKAVEFDILRGEMSYLNSKNSPEYIKSKQKLDKLIIQQKINYTKDFRFNDALRLIKEQKYNAAIYELNTLIEENYNVSKCYELLGDICFNSKKPIKKTVQYYKNSLKYDNSNTSTLFKLANIYIKENKNIIGLEYLALLVENTDDYELLRRVEEIILNFGTPDNKYEANNFYETLANVQVKLGKREDSYRNYSKALQANPEDIFLKYQLLDLLYEDNCAADTVKLADIILYQKRNDSQIRTTKAKALAKEGNLNSAYKEYIEILKQNPNSKQAKYGIYKLLENKVPLATILKKIHFDNLGYTVTKEECTAFAKFLDEFDDDGANSFRNLAFQMEEEERRQIEYRKQQEILRQQEIAKQEELKKQKLQEEQARIAELKLQKQKELELKKQREYELEQEKIRKQKEIQEAKKKAQLEAKLKKEQILKEKQEKEQLEIKRKAELKLKEEKQKQLQLELVKQKQQIQQKQLQQEAEKKKAEAKLQQEKLEKQKQEKLQKEYEQRKITQELKAFQTKNPKKYTEYNSALNNYLKVEPKDSKTYLAIANTYKLLEAPTASIQYYKSAIKLSPTDSDLYYSLALAYMELDSFETAYYNLEKAIKLDPQNIKAKNLIAFVKQKLVTRYINNAYSKFEEKKYLEASQILDDGIKKFPQNAQLYYYRALSYDAMNRNAAAIIDLQKAINLDSSLYMAFYQLGKSYEKIKDERNALVAYERFLSIEPEEKELIDEIQEKVISLGQKYY